MKSYWFYKNIEIQGFLEHVMRILLGIYKISLMQCSFKKWSFFQHEHALSKRLSYFFKFLSLQIVFFDENKQLYRHFLSIFSAVQHERAPRTYSKKPSYFSDFSAIAAGAAAVAAASNHHQIAPGSIHSGARPPLLNPLGIPHGMHPYYPLHHFKSFFPALFPHASSGEFIYNCNKIHKDN